MGSYELSKSEDEYQKHKKMSDKEMSTKEVEFNWLKIKNQIQKPEGLSWEHIKNEKGIDMAIINRQTLVDFMNYAESIDQQNSALRKEFEELMEKNEKMRELLCQVKIFFHQDVLMDDEYDGIWRDSDETILENINKTLTP